MDEIRIHECGLSDDFELRDGNNSNSTASIFFVEPERPDATSFYALYVDDNIVQHYNTKSEIERRIKKQIIHEERK